MCGTRFRKCNLIIVLQHGDRILLRDCFGVVFRLQYQFKQTKQKRREIKCVRKRESAYFNGLLGEEVVVRVQVGIHSGEEKEIVLDM